MLDLRFVREHLDEIRLNVKNRRAQADPDLVVRLYDERNALQQRIDAARAARNANAEKMKAKLSPEDRAKLVDEGRRLKEEIAGFEATHAEADRKLTAEALKLPNMSHPDAPIAAGEEGNLPVRTWGKPAAFGFAPKDHLALGQSLDLIDFDAGARVAGQKFYYLKNEAVLLEQSLVRYTLDILREEGFTLLSTPDIAREEIVAGHGFTPRGEESNLYTIEGTDLLLIGTAEITLGGYHAGQVLDAEKLPVLLCGLSHCFRREAGAAGQFSKGLYRVHQFTKVEMFVYCHPSGSAAMLDRLVGIEERIYQGLELPYRIVDTCTGDLGGPAYRKYDFEAWMPCRGERGEYGEITSASDCTDFQARRLGIKFREAGKNAFLHTLNGTAVAVPRIIVALLENFQQADGTVVLPAKIAAYAGFTRIEPKGGR
jgi:seryl-tRNA synthetase